MKPQSNAKEIELVEMRAVYPKDLPAFTRANLERCSECRKQYVTVDGEAICAHQVIRHWSTNAVKKICRQCWNQYSTKAKYTGQSSPWQIGEYVTK